MKATALSFCCLVSAGLAYADAVQLVGQYVSDKNTTMTIHADGKGLVISGRGEFSMYNAQCQATSATTAACQGTGTRLEDHKAYTAIYQLSASPDGKRLSSTWRTTYGNGEAYTGTTQLKRVD
jgi:hypothetical protein